MIEFFTKFPVGGATCFGWTLMATALMVPAIKSARAATWSASALAHGVLIVAIAVSVPGVYFMLRWIVSLAPL